MELFCTAIRMLAALTGSLCTHLYYSHLILQPIHYYKRPTKKSCKQPLAVNQQQYKKISTRNQTYFLLIIIVISVIIIALVIVALQKAYNILLQEGKIGICSYERKSFNLFL